MSRAPGRARREQRKEPRPPKRRTSALVLPWDRIANTALAVFALGLAWLVLYVHRTPLYGVETDLFGEALPAARGLLSGHVDSELFAFKGPGYPLLLALGTLIAGGDAWLGARILNLLGAVAGAWAAWRMLRRALGPERAAFATLALCVNPLYVRAAFEAGTDAPTCALALLVTALVLDAPRLPQAALAGLVTGFAILCRYNAAFLFPAALAALVLWPARPGERWRNALGFAAGAALVLLPWLVYNQRLHGAALSNRNFANLAYELYGGGMPWDRFWDSVAPRFHSFGDVLRFDPAGAAAHLAKNFAVRWTMDLRQLLPVWLGAMALLGALLHLRKAPRHLAWLGFYALSYATLCLVFYAARFFLYLVPFYLGAAALLVFPAAKWAQRWPLLRLGTAAIALVASALATGRDIGTLAHEQPEEMRIAGRFLAARARPGDRVLARKPQVAYFAGMEYGPVPTVERIEGLILEARRAHAGYIFLSGIEYALRPQLRLMMQEDVRLPGLTPLKRIYLDDTHYGTVFQVDPAGPADAGFRDSMVASLDRFLPQVAGNPQQLAYLGALYFYENQFDKSLLCLDKAIALAPGELGSIAYRAIVLSALGRLDESARDCETLIASTPKLPPTHALLLGSIRARQGRMEEARRHIEAAAKAEPALPGAQVCLGMIRLATGDRAGGDEALARAVQLVPHLAVVREAALEHAAKGDTAWLVRLLERARRVSGDDTLPIEGLAEYVTHGGPDLP